MLEQCLAGLQHFVSVYFELFEFAQSAESEVSCFEQSPYVYEVDFDSIEANQFLEHLTAIEIDVVHKYEFTSEEEVFDLFIVSIDEKFGQFSLVSHHFVNLHKATVIMVVVFKPILEKMKSFCYLFPLVYPLLGNVFDQHRNEKIHASFFC